MSDPFQTLGVEPVFTLDLGALERRHRELSRALHPDRFAGRPPSERRQALSRAIEVNEAFRALRDPVRRGEAMLQQRGAQRAEGSEPRPDAAFLMDVMERREALSEARKRRDIAAVRELERQIKAQEAEAQGLLGKLFAAEPFDAEAAELRLGELRYYRRFLEEAGAIEDEIA